MIKVNELVSCQPTLVNGTTGDFGFSDPGRNITTLNMILSVSRSLDFLVLRAIHQFLDRISQAMELHIVKNAISQTLASVSSDIPATTVHDALKRCYSSWHSIYCKYQRDLEHINSDLAPDLNNIMRSQLSMVTIADIASRQTYNTPSRLNSITCLEKQNKETSCRVNTLIKAVSEWDSVPQAIHDSLSLCATTLEKQTMDLALMFYVTERLPTSK
jgi:hypothetical protein